MVSTLLQPKTAMSLLALAAVLILLSAFALQYIGGVEPCQMCIWQRWPYAVLALLGILALVWQPKAALALALLTLLVSIGLASYHVAVEQGWVALPTGCAAGAGASSVEELKALLAEAPPSCDQVDFTLFGLSLAAWNLISSLALTAFTLIALLTDHRQNARIAHQT